ncbi:MAG: DUF503 domain-containing protein [Deltaproteobacteria bacterium]|nr:MAG: DUF503 domain-containing protein [Deltaproteobacteria bacterium]
MYVGIMRLEIRLHGAGSLKEKRSVVRSLLGRLRNRFSVSAAEVDCQDIWQRAAIGVTMVAADRNQIETEFRRIEEFIEMNGLAELGERQTDIFVFA